MQRTRRGRTETAVVDWGFNAWGGKYPPWDADDAVPTRVAAALGLPVFHADIVMEGGAVDFNGAGTLLTTTSCLLNTNRNPRLSQADVERYLKDYYGQRHVVWLGEGIAGDDTDGHVDDLARFIDERHDRHGSGGRPGATPTTACCATTAGGSSAPATPTAGRSRSSSCRCRAPVVLRGQRLPATYMNFYSSTARCSCRRSATARRDRQALAPPAARAAAAAGGRRRLPGAHLGPRRDPLPDPAAAGRLTRRCTSWCRQCRCDRPSGRVVADQAFSRAAGAPLVDGNAVRLLQRRAPRTTRPGSTPSHAAERWIHFESYIIHDDAAGARVRRRADRAGRAPACGCG